MHYLNVNGKIIPQHILSASAFKQEDGFFETMRYSHGKIPLISLHLKRMGKTAEKLNMFDAVVFDQSFILEEVNKLIIKNQQSDDVRIRITFFKSQGSLNFIIQSTNAEPLVFQEQGWSAGIYPNEIKTINENSNLKLNNNLIYVKAGLWAREHQYNEAFILNTGNNICESSIANIYILLENNIYTPPLTEGCISGVMRSFILEHRNQFPYPIKEKPISEEMISNATEIFISNAFRSIVPINFFNREYFPATVGKQMFYTVQQLIQA